MRSVVLAAILLLGLTAATPAPAYLRISSHLTHSARVHLSWGVDVTVPARGFVDARIPAAALAAPFRMNVTSQGISPYAAPGSLPAGRMTTVDGRRYWCVNLTATLVQTYTSDECEMDVADTGESLG